MVFYKNGFISSSNHNPRIIAYPVPVRITLQAPNTNTSLSEVTTKSMAPQMLRYANSASALPEAYAVKIQLLIKIGQGNELSLNSTYANERHTQLLTA